MSGAGIDIADVLEEQDACEPGTRAALAVFGSLLPPGVTEAWAVAVAAGVPELRPHVGWAVGRLVEPEEVGVVAGANLRWANLRGADLRGANLRWANLRWAVLAGADLTGAPRHPADPPTVGWVVADGRLRRQP